ARVLHFSSCAGTTGPRGSYPTRRSSEPNLSATVSGLPVDGSPVYVRLWTQLGGGTGWVLTDYTYAAASQSKAVLTSPAPGTTLPGGVATFNWSAGAGALQYSLSDRKSGVEGKSVDRRGRRGNLAEKG